jgi:NAD(P)-dependent dehydrogenase (short-subunit alcohol dehydrogenase family)
MTQAQVEALIGRSNRLGADPRNTNYAGGNTSAKGTATDPVTGEDVELLWVKGSGGDLGTLTASGLAVLRLDRLRALAGVYPGVDREDDMVAAFDFSLHGLGGVVGSGLAGRGAAPSIDTAMHGLVAQPHVDHLHPDSGIALATAADGEKLTAECFGDRVVWVPWRRPGFQLGLDIAAIAAANPQAIGCILGGHGITAWGACVVVADRDAESAAAVAAEIGGPDFAIACTADVTDEEQVAAAIAAAALAFGGVDLVVNNAGLSVSKPLLETTVADWDTQHDVMARGSFLVSREAVRAMRAQRMGGDIVYICSKNSVVAGPDNLAYGAAKADQAHQVRLLAAELGGDGIRVNGVNPDAVVRGSGIFAGGWGAQRAAVYGVAETDLGAYYARRTLLKKEVLPSHVADAVFALTGGNLSQTTGLHIPVDSGVAAGFLR